MYSITKAVIFRKKVLNNPAKNVNGQNESDLKLKPFHGENNKMHNNNISTLRNRKAEVKEKLSKSELEARLKEYMAADPARQRIKTFVAESDALVDKAESHGRMENYDQAINILVEAKIKLKDALELMYERLEHIRQREKTLLSKIIKKQPIQQRVGIPKREYFDRLLRGDTMKSTLFLNLRYDLVAKWIHELEYLTKTNNETVSTRKSMIVSIENMNLLTSNEMPNDSFLKTEFLIKMGCSECDGNKIILRGTMHSPPILISALRRRISKQLFIPSSNEHIHWAIFKIDLEHLMNASAGKDRTKSISIYI